MTATRNTDRLRVLIDAGASATVNAIEYAEVRDRDETVAALRQRTLYIRTTRPVPHNSLTPAPGVSKDRIQANTVTDCRVGAYGIWLFVPGADALVDGNSVSYCQVGLALVGGGISTGPSIAGPP